MKALGRATIAEFGTLIKSIHRSICRPAPGACSTEFTFCSVCECTINSQCRTPYTEPRVRSISCPWRYYRPTISCEPGTAKVYLKKMKRKKKKKLDKTKHWGIKTVCLWIYSVSGIPRQNENKNKMVHMGIEPGSRDSQANALNVTPRHLHLMFASFYCI